jgi:hypothetical protein
MAQVTVKGITYNVEQRNTVADTIANGHNNTARVMQENNCVAHLVLRRPKGQVYYMATEFASGHINEPFSIGA